jgi:membrane-bound serine protease (ClpP class)
LPLLLLLVGIGLAVMDVFFPSGGILAFLAVCAIGAAVVEPFVKGEPTVGLVILAVTLFGLPATVILALKWWPKTALGRKFLLHVPSSEEVLPEDHPRRTLERLVGRVGRAKSKMLPSGIIVIDKRSYDAVGEGIPIEAGQRVRVKEVRGNRLIVEAAGDEAPSETDMDPLARPFDWDSEEAGGTKDDG